LLYREALVLFALVGQSHADPLFVPVLREYEHVLFPNGPEEAVRSGRFQAVKDAMKDITDLLTPRDDPYLSWAPRWFAGIGHDETNPITLGVFLVVWMDWYKGRADKPEQDGGVTARFPNGMASSGKAADSTVFQSNAAILSTDALGLPPLAVAVFQFGNLDSTTKISITSKTGTRMIPEVLISQARCVNPNPRSTTIKSGRTANETRRSRIAWYHDVR
jgi:hypothetical protein